MEVTAPAAHRAAPVIPALEGRVLQAERLRAGLLAAALGLLVSVYWGLDLVAPELFRGLAHLEGHGRGNTATLLALLLYALTLRHYYGRLLATNRVAPVAVQYVNAFIEASLPTLTIIYIARAVNPVHALLMPPYAAYYLFILLSTLRLDFWLSAFTGAVGAVEYLLLASTYVGRAAGENLDRVLLAPTHHAGKASVVLLAGLLAGLVGRELRREFSATLQSVEERERLFHVLGRHLSPQVARELTSRLEGAELRRVSVMFVDVRGFTRFAEGKGPAEVVAYLNRLFAIMVEEVHREGGIVNKFLGDGLMAVFGAPIARPDAAAAAARAALAMVARVATACGSGLPPTRLGIGIHAGEALTGVVGTAERAEYTVIGDTVNVASRIEALNKKLGTQILVTGEAWREVPEGQLAARAVHEEAVPGRAAPVQVHVLA